MYFDYRGSDGCQLHTMSVGAGPPLVLLHGGGPDHHSLVPIGQRFTDRFRVLLPDVRGYGRSICVDPARHTWAQYTDDVFALLDAVGEHRAVLCGTGLGSTVVLRACLARPDRVAAAVVIGVEDIEDDEGKAAETAMLERFAETARTDGLDAAWAPILGMLPPVITAMIRDAIPRSDPVSVAAAAAIGRDRAFGDIAELAESTVPTLVFPGSDPRHPTRLGEEVAERLPSGVLAPVSVSFDMHTEHELAAAVGPTIDDFLDELGAGVRAPSPL